jgi:hypothetical protein
MYYERVLSTKEATFVNRAQQKIAELGVILSEQATRGDVDYEHHQLAVELQYVIDSLKSTFLDWTEDEIGTVIDFYTLRGELAVIAYNQMNFMANMAISGDIYATLVQLNAVDQAQTAAQTAGQAFDQSERDRLEQESKDRDDAIQIGQGANWAADFISEIKLGGVSIGDEYLEGSPLETTLRNLLSEAKGTSNFTYTGYVSLIEVGTTVIISLFTWSVTGNPVNLTISDDGSHLINEAVSGTSYAPPSALSYAFNTNKSITWTLKGDSISNRTKTTTAVYKSYYGKKTVANDDNLITVTESDILAGDPYLQVTSSQVTVTADTTNSEMGWIAVPKAQSGSDYTIWYVDALNSSAIGIGEFISAPVDVTVNGIVYSVYRWSYRSPLAKPITLKR